jgi:hypothetical protein
MRRAATLGLGALVVGGALLVLRGRPYRVPEGPVVPVASALKQETPSVSARMAPPAESASPPPGLPLEGRAVPALPSDAPKSVAFGVIVLWYRGAEGAPPDARSKEAALASARALLPEAQRNFDDAVKKGDRGSIADVGSMPQGVLEPALEYALFTLKKGEVYGDPLDSPRGYWIIRRR